MKLDEIKCAYEVVDSAGVEQARIGMYFAFPIENKRACKETKE